MKTDKNVKKIIIKIDSDVQQQNVKTPRRGLRTIQPTATDKENLAGRSHILKDSKLALDTEIKKEKPLLMHKETQTEKYITNIDDITGEEASIDYWKRVAEKRQESLDDSFREIEKLKDKVESLEEENKLYKEKIEDSIKISEENMKLKEDIGNLQQENKICKEMLEESRHLVEVLQEMINEGEDDNAPAEESENQE